MALVSGCRSICPMPNLIDTTGLISGCAPCPNDILPPPTPRIDTERNKCCDNPSSDGVTIVEYFTVTQYDDLSGAVVSSDTFMDAAGTIPYTPVNPVPCPGTVDLELVTKCFQDPNDASIKYNQITSFNASNGSIVNVVWQDCATGATLPTAPAGVIPCQDICPPLTGGIV